MQTGRVNDSLLWSVNGRGKNSRWREFGTTNTRHKVQTLNNGDAQDKAGHKGNVSHLKLTKCLCFPLELGVERIWIMDS